jgi:hypothetical protein
MLNWNTKRRCLLSAERCDISKAYNSQVKTPWFGPISEDEFTILQKKFWKCAVYESWCTKKKRAVNTALVKAETRKKSRWLLFIYLRASEMKQYLEKKRVHFNVETVCFQTIMFIKATSDSQEERWIHLKWSCGSTGYLQPW